MQVTMQVKVSLDKAQQLKERLKVLQDAAVANREDVEERLAKAKNEKDRTLLADALVVAKELEKDMNISNLLRALLNHGMHNLLDASPTSLMLKVSNAKVPMGRPRHDKEVSNG